MPWRSAARSLPRDAAWLTGPGPSSGGVRIEGSCWSSWSRSRPRQQPWPRQTVCAGDPIQAQLQVKQAGAAPSGREWLVIGVVGLGLGPASSMLGTMASVVSSLTRFFGARCANFVPAEVGRSRLAPAQRRWRRVGAALPDWPGSRLSPCPASFGSQDIRQDVGRAQLGPCERAATPAKSPALPSPQVSR